MISYLLNSWSLILQPQINNYGSQITLGGWYYYYDEDNDFLQLISYEDDGNSFATLLLLPSLNSGLVVATNTNIVDGMRQQLGLYNIIIGEWDPVNNPGIALQHWF